MKSYPVQVIFREYLEGIIAAVFLAAFLRIFVLNVLYVPTNNMEPGLEKGDFVLGWKLAYGFQLPLADGERLNQKIPKRGDVVAFRFPGDEEQLIIRRVAALPGDKIVMNDGQLSINGNLADYKQDDLGSAEKFLGERSFHDIKNSINSELKEMTIPEGQFFVLSDHRAQFDDSRVWGLVPLKNIESRIYWTWLSVDNSEKGLKFRWQRMFQWVN